MMYPERSGSFRPNTVERAFELASSGACCSVEEIRDQLTREDYSSVQAHLSGPLIKSQLKSLCVQRRRRRRQEARRR